MFLVRGCCRALSLALIAASVGLAACGPDPTPLPVHPVETAAPAEATAEADVTSFAVQAALLDLLPDEARTQISSVAVLMPFEGAPPATVSGWAALTPFSGGAAAGYMLPAALRLNTSRPPLNDPVLADALRAALEQAGAGQAEAMTLRSALANAGYPDGLTLMLADAAGVSEQALPLLAALPVEWLPAGDTASAHAVLLAGAEAEAALGEGGIALGSLPVYLSAGWTWAAGADGVPVLARAGD